MINDVAVKVQSLVNAKWPYANERKHQLIASKEGEAGFSHNNTFPTRRGVKRKTLDNFIITVMTNKINT